jgi:beta-lactam-binding protein with PASTA domain
VSSGFRSYRVRGPDAETRISFPVGLALTLVLGLGVLGAACGSDDQEPGSATVRVPRVVDLPVNEATEILESAGLAWRLVDDESGEASATVVRQDPGPGVSVEMGTTVSISVEDSGT